MPAVKGFRSINIEDPEKREQLVKKLQHSFHQVAWGADTNGRVWVSWVRTEDLMDLIHAEDYANATAKLRP